MDPVAAELMRQHLDLLTHIQQVYTALAVMAFMGLVLLFAMVGAAIWSVHAVNQRQQGLEAKFTLLIDVLLERARQENLIREAAHGN